MAKVAHHATVPGAGAGVYTKHIIKNTVLYSAVYGVYTRAEETYINIIKIN